MSVHFVQNVHNNLLSSNILTKCNTRSATALNIGVILYMKQEQFFPNKIFLGSIQIP